MKTSELIDRVEKDFDCVAGDRKAFCDHNGKLTPYVVYAATSSNESSLTQWLLDNVFVPLKEAGAEKLYWRNEERIEHYTHTPLSEKESKEWDMAFRPNSTNKIYTRIAVFGRNDIPIRISGEIKLEGELCKELEDED